MPAVTDLSWSDLNNGLRKLTGQENGNFIVLGGENTNPRVVMDITGLISSPSPTLSNMGTIKLLSMLLDAARIEQEFLNQGKATGERLTAFPSPTFGILANGFAPITRTLAARAILSSAAQIVGTNA